MKTLEQIRKDREGKLIVDKLFKDKIGVGISECLITPDIIIIPCHKENINAKKEGFK